VKITSGAYVFAKIKSRLSSMSTIKALCLQAEQYALRDQQRQPGAEHFLLAALDLPDDTAKQAFAAIGADAATLRSAITRQYEAALRSVGVDPQVTGANDLVEQPLQPQDGLYDASASGKEVMQSLAENRQAHHPILSAHVVAVVATMKHGVAARALRTMGIDADQLRSAAEKVVNGMGEQQ
jgi:ATP-dependent Clp protease ATP-binding subunit ClpA